MTKEDSLFELSKESYQPLAHRVRPKTQKEFIGQDHLALLANDNSETRSVLNIITDKESTASLIFHGPPGCGKTTLAHIVANESSAELITLNGSQCSVHDVRKASAQAEDNLKIGRKTIVLIDEIHRFNKAQQDSLLEPIEHGVFRLIGATTENPFFGVSSPLVSRCLLIELKSLSPKDIHTILKATIASVLNNLEIGNECLQYISEICNGDARSALNILELANKIAEPNILENKRTVELKDIKSLVSKNLSKYDKKGDNHYDQISAFIKSMRGSDPDASLYWLARLIYSGEDPLYIARRLVIHAAEDVGLADPSALQTAVAAQRAVETIGMPEAKIPLAMAALHIAMAPKSNSSCAGIKKAMAFIEKNSGSLGNVPSHLRDSHYEGAKILGNGSNYLFPHFYKNGVVDQNYLPENLTGKNLGLYESSKMGYEDILNKELQKKKEPS
jgi:putative ATPase